jgi:hypothetical protein
MYASWHIPKSGGVHMVDVLQRSTLSVRLMWQCPMRLYPQDSAGLLFNQLFDPALMLAPRAALKVDASSSGRREKTLGAASWYPKGLLIPLLTSTGLESFITLHVRPSSFSWKRGFDSCGLQLII